MTKICLICKDKLHQYNIENPKNNEECVCLNCVVHLGFKDENDQEEFKVYDLKNNYLEDFTKFLYKNLMGYEDWLHNLTCSKENTDWMQYL